MRFELVNVAESLQTRGIDLSTGSGVDTLLANLRTVASIDSWSYSFEQDKLTIEAYAGTLLDAFLEFGEVVLDDSSLG
jgi:hypothetical protein